MTKSEFIGALRERLDGEVSRAEMEKSLCYYEHYFDEAVRGGKREEEVAEELGSPFLIAKTIIDTSDSGAMEEQAYYGQEEDYRDENTGNFRHYRMDLGDWKAKLLLIVILLAVIFLLATILRVLIPLAVPIAIVLILVHHFRNH